MTYSEQGDVLDNMLRAIQKEDYTHEEEQVIISGHHVFGTQVHERNYSWSIYGLDKVCVRPFYRVSERACYKQRQKPCH